MDLETEKLAGYILEHLHASGGNPLSQGNSLPENLANGLTPRYRQHQEKLYRRIVAACHWLINNGYRDVINGQGFYEISKKGNDVTTAAEFNAQLNITKSGPPSDFSPDTIQVLKALLAELNDIAASLTEQGYSKVVQRFERWKSRAVAYIADHFGAQEAEKLTRNEMLDTLTPIIARHSHNHTIRTFKDCQSFLEVMIDEIRIHGEDVYSKQRVSNTHGGASPGLTNQRGNHSLADPQTDEADELLAQKTMYTFPKMELSEAEMIWLCTISNQFLRGFLVDVERLKKTLHAEGKWPRNFRPSEIDYRLLQRENIPTLLGIWHVDPHSAWIEKCDQLIRYIKARLPRSTELKVAELAEAIGESPLNVSILIHLLPSVGLYYTAIGALVRHDTVRIPGQLGTYVSLQLDDPEKSDGYLDYENLEAQIKKVYGDETSNENEPPTEEKLIVANRLYDSVKALIEKPEALNENEARIIVESTDDAVKEFGSTNQEKKVELRKWKAQAELALPPSTIEELRKRAEGELLKRSYPRNVIGRNILLTIVATLVIIGGLLTLKQAFSGHSDTENKNSSTANNPDSKPSLALSTAGPAPTAVPSQTFDINQPGLAKTFALNPLQIWKTVKDAPPLQQDDLRKTISD